MPENKPASNNHIAKQLAKQISAQGPISILEYMRIANEAYYDSRDPFGSDGDFITAPEISQMFGEMIGLWMADIWIQKGTPSNINYVELGPGRGTLASDILRSGEKFGFKPAPFFVEKSDTLRKAQSEAIANANFCSSVDELPDDGPLFIVANEFFDALPIKQFISTHSGWRERVLTRDKGNKFIAMPGTSDVGGFIPNDIRSAPVDTIFETCPEASNIIYELVSKIKNQGGMLLVIDYGYDKLGHGSTLQALSNHKFADPFENPGERDLSAHVNFMEMANIGRIRDMQIGGPVNQGNWLEYLGLNIRAEKLMASSPERSEEINNARKRLVDEDEMGRLFKVLCLAHIDWPLGEGFANKGTKIDLDESLI